jgi:hypothetical protein
MGDGLSRGSPGVDADVERRHGAVLLQNRRSRLMQQLLKCSFL